ncbi:MAG: lactoylglutathione lyase, partial [Paracoccaceae bacterium]
FRGHFCMVVEDFVALFRRLDASGCVDVRPWGNVRRLPDGGMQMFARDPAGNLLEFASRPEEVIDPALFESDLVDTEAGLYQSGREDGRGLGSADATLHHGDEKG